MIMQKCIDEQQPFGVVLIKYGQEAGGPAIPFEIGTSALIAQVERLEDERLNLIVVGRERFRIAKLTQERPYMVADVEPLTSVIGDDPQLGAVAGTVSALFQDYFRLQLALDGQWARSFNVPDNPMVLADFVAARMTTSNRVKQTLLETLSVSERLRREENVLEREIQGLSTQLKRVLGQRYSTLSVLN